MKNNLKKLLKKHEGLRLKPYYDTVNKLTIGWGRNIDDNGISKEEAEILLNNDIEKVLFECNNAFHWFEKLDETRQVVVANMVFNLGMPTFKKFKRTIHFIRLSMFEKAAEEMLDSKWARQVGNRATELSELMKNGE